MSLHSLRCLSAVAALASVLVDAGGAKAAIFTVRGQDYDITTFFGRYNASVAKFNTPNNNGVMPWWGDGVLSIEFATTVAGALGLPNSGGGRGPLFASQASVISVIAYVYTPPNVEIRPLRPDSDAIFAQATVVPGPFPVLGAATAFGMSRRLRRRIASRPCKP